MACIDERRSLINLNKESKKLEHETILGDPAENMNYNKSNIFSTGIISHHIKGYDGEDDIKNNYMVFGYENPIPNDNIKKMFICNNEEKRSANGIQEKGMGIKHVFHKYSEQIEVLSIKDKIIDTYFKMPLDRHIDDLKNNKDINVNENMLTLQTSENNKKFGEIFNSHPHIKEIYQNIKKYIDKYNIDNDDDINMPNSIIIIKLLNYYDCEIEDIYNSINHIYSIKYIKKTKNKYYIFNNFKEDNVYDFKRIENKDLLMYDKRKDAFKFYIKKISTKLIFYFRCQNVYYYYNFTSDGKGSGLQELINSDHNLYDKVKNLNDTNDDFNFEVYRIDTNDYENFKKTIDLSEEHYAGFYFLLDNTILNHNPSSLNDMIGKSVRNTGGTRARYIIEIKDKSLFDLRGIKPEFSIKDQKQKQLIKFLWNTLWQSHNSALWNKEYIPCNKCIKPEIILNHFKTNCLSRNQKKTIKVSKTKENNATIKTLYLTLYDLNEDEYKFLGKIGFCGEISKANDRNNKNIKKPIISQLYINNLINSGGQEIENTIKNYLYNSNIDIQEKGNNITERFIFNEIKIYKKIEKKFIKTRDLLLNNNMDIKLCNQEINNIWENNNNQSDTFIDSNNQIDDIVT